MRISDWSSDVCSYDLQSGKTIVVFRPTVRVGAQSTGGIFEPNADWTDQARKNIDEALAKRQAKLGNEVISAPMSYGDEARLDVESSVLFAAVSQSVIQYRFFVVNPLPPNKPYQTDAVFEGALCTGVT